FVNPESRIYPMNRSILLTLCLLTPVIAVAADVPSTVAKSATLTVQAAPTAGKPISPDLFGIFFEDLNYAADGGLYAELVQNRSFEYTAAGNGGWNSLTSWDLIKEDGGEGHATVRTGVPLNANNPHYVALVVANGK